MENKDKLFGRYNELVLIVIGFILTGVLGNLITQELQYRDWEFKKTSDIRERELNVASSTFEAISKLMDRRLYLSRQLLWALEADSENIDDKLKDYREVLYEWNFSLNRNFALIEKYFGNEYRSRFDSKIHGKLRLLNTQLSEYRKGNISQLETASKIADSVNVEIFHFNIQMLEKIQNQTVGINNT